MASSPINTTPSSSLAVLVSISIQMSRALAQGMGRIKSQKSQPLWDVQCLVLSFRHPACRGPWTATLRKWILWNNLCSVSCSDSVSPSQLLTQNHQSQTAARGYSAIVSRGNQCSVELLIYSPWKWTLLSICSREHSPKSPGNLPPWQSEPLQPDLKSSLCKQLIPHASLLTYISFHLNPFPHQLLF